MKYFVYLFLFSCSGFTYCQSFYVDLNTAEGLAPSEGLLAMVIIPKDEGNEIDLSTSIKLALGCDNTIFLTQNPIPPSVYHASYQIIATGVVQGNVILKAEVEVLLEDGFEVQVGGELEIMIEPCVF